MMKARWSRSLYQKQAYPNNYMSSPEKKVVYTNYDTMYEVNRLSKNISAIFMHFSVYYYIKKNSASPALFLILAAISICMFCMSRRVGTVHTVVQTCIILGIVFLVTTILKTLVDEISDDTVYLHFVVLSLFFIFDTTRCAVMNDTEHKTDLGDKPLTIEYVDILKIKEGSIPILGYNAALLSTIILTSRLNTNEDAFFLLCFTFFWYFVVEHSVRSKKRPAEFVFSALIIVLTSVIYLHILVDVFYVFATTQAVLYLTGLVSIHLVNKEIK